MRTSLPDKARLSLQALREVAKTAGVLRSRAVLTLAALSLAVLACAKTPKGTGPEPASAPPRAPPAPSRAAAAPAAGLEGIEGMDFSALSGPARTELAAVLADEFCYCGCPHTVGACLRTHPTCRHAKRMARLAASEVSTGAPASEVLVTLSRYYGGFREKRASFTLDPRMCRGPADAKVTLVEFADFECPFCAAARPMLDAFVQEHAADVRFCYLPFPLDVHPNAVPAAQAVLLARESGKFWAMHDAVFENNKSLGREALVALGSRVGLPAGALDRALTAGTYKDEVERIKAAGIAAGVQGTPTLFFNGRPFTLNFTPGALAHALEDELEWSGNQQAWAQE